ncbi:MAG: iron-containing alcohol dehydrogenase [Planctomycetia bacterium]|nr:iron-containing alcohol dehydrogenase [Planctomycetia bacterium]
MQNFEYCVPTRIVFGKGQIARLAALLSDDAKILMTSGGSSIHKNGVYEQVMAALEGKKVTEFSGIEPNPKYETCMKAVEIVRNEGIDFLLSVGGGSTLDGTKFIAAAAKYEGDDPWDILAKGAEVREMLPIGCVMTLPATGSEMNGWSVVSRISTTEKLSFWSQHSFPQFSILDPEVTKSLPPRQVSNGIVDTFVHVVEQYITYPVNTPVQDRQAEGVLLTLVEEGPKVFAHPDDYDVRANLFWAATTALNGWLAQGVVQDWAIHGIGHEITAFTGTDHAKTLALVLPALWKHQRKEKQEKLLQYARRVWNIQGDDANAVIDEAIAKTVAFFESVGISASRKAYGVTEEVCRQIESVFLNRGVRLGERGNLGGHEVYEILQLTAE